MNQREGLANLIGIWAENGISNYELETLARSLDIENFAGVFMDDEIGAGGVIQENECGIVNYQVSSESGSHWICYWCVEEVDYICYFDSAGLPPTENMLSYLKSQQAKEILYNDEPLQAEDWTCGLFCIYFLKELDISDNIVETYNSLQENEHNDVLVLHKILKHLGEQGYEINLES